MITIKETTNSFGTKYEKYKGNVLSSCSQITLLQQSHHSYNYILLIDTNGQVIYEAYDYINSFLENDSYKKKELAVNALKVFFSFIELFNIKDYKCINKNDISKLLRFLEGGTVNSPLISLELSTTRSNKTINMYLSIYRQFFKFLQIKNSPFEETSIYKTYKNNNGFLSHASTGENYKYTSNVPVYTPQRIKPYIKFEQYKELIKLLDSSNSKFMLRNKLIIKLMYEYGLRISEVLGLTVEDLEFDISHISENSDGFGRILLRNRVSDKQYHHCKNLYIPKTIDDYKLPQYNKEGYGYNFVTVPIETLNLLQEYIDQTMNPFNISDKAIQSISKRKADKVDSNSQIHDNYYIFISKNFTPLSVDGWNKILRKLFKQINIEIDSDVKSTNLSHKFRHGFAMYLKSLGLSRVDIMHKLRQTSLSSVDIYFSTDIEDDIELTKEVTSHIRRELNLN